MVEPKSIDHSVLCAQSNAFALLITFMYFCHIPAREWPQPNLNCSVRSNVLLRDRYVSIGMSNASSYCTLLACRKIRTSLWDMYSSTYQTNYPFGNIKDSTTNGYKPTIYRLCIFPSKIQRAKPTTQSSGNVITEG